MPDTGFPWGQVLASVGGVLLLMLSIVQSRLKQVTEQFKANGGSSVRDQLNRIEVGMSANKGRIWALMNNSELAIWESTADGGCVYVNKTGLRWLGRTNSEMTGRGWINSIVREDRARVIEEWHAAVTDQRTFELTYGWLASDDTEFEVHAQSHPLRDSNNNITGWIGICERTP